jgi:ankyrin repeat protein
MKNTLCLIVPLFIVAAIIPGVVSGGPIHQAVEDGNADWVKRLIASGENVNEMDYEKKTPLHIAVAKNNKPMIDYLISKGANVNKVGWIGTPLHVAVLRGDVDLVGILIDKGAKVNISSERGTPLQLTAEYGQVEVAKYLIKRGGNPNVKNEKGQTLLHISVAYRKSPFSEYLVDELKVNVNALDKNQQTPIGIALIGVPLSYKPGIVEYLESKGGHK